MHFGTVSHFLVYSIVVRHSLLPQEWNDSAV